MLLVTLGGKRSSKKKRSQDYVVEFGVSFCSNEVSTGGLASSQRGSRASSKINNCVPKFRAYVNEKLEKDVRLLSGASPWLPIRHHSWRGHNILQKWILNRILSRSGSLCSFNFCGILGQLTSPLFTTRITQKLKVCNRIAL